MNSLMLMDGETCVQNKGRVIHQEKSLYKVKIGNETKEAVLSGKLRHTAENAQDLPVVGDEVLCSQIESDLIRIEEVCARKTILLRKTAGGFAGEQLLAANLERVFYLSSLNQDMNLRRMERYLVMIRDGGIEPIVILSKADLVDEALKEEVVDLVYKVVGSVPVHVISAFEPETCQKLLSYFEPGMTLALLGSSGVGKSTLTNALLGREEQVIQSISGDKDRGRHTTTSRSLFELENGSFLMDTPGIREIQLWEGDVGVGETFGDVIELITSCRFSNCTHHNEPGCKVSEAIESGEMDELRLKSYLKLKREQLYIAMKTNALTRKREKSIWKQRSKVYRRGKKREWERD